MDKKDLVQFYDPEVAEQIQELKERLSKIAPPFDLPIFSGLIEIQKLTKTIEDVLEPIRKAQEEMAKAFKAALIDDEGRERVHKIAQAWASFGLCPPIGNESFDQWSPPKSEKEVEALYEHFLKEECPETYCQAYLSQKAGVAYEYAKEAVDDFKRGAYRSCAAMLFALLDGELLRKEIRQEKPKNSKDYRLLLGPRFYCDKVRDKKEQDFYITYIVPQCFFLTANYYYENAVDFQNPATQLIGLRPCLDHGMLLHVDGLTCFKIFTLVPYCDYSIRWAFRSESEDK